jgi:hypothetical protein
LTLKINPFKVSLKENAPCFAVTRDFLLKRTATLVQKMSHFQAKQASAFILVSLCVKPLFRRPAFHSTLDECSEEKLVSLINCGTKHKVMLLILSAILLALNGKAQDKTTTRAGHVWSMEIENYSVHLVYTL